MRLIKICLLVYLMSIFAIADEEKISINLKDQKIMDLVKITSKILDKNILVTQHIQGEVDYISNKPVTKDELLKILIFVLESKGYTLINNGNMLRIVRLNDSAKSNLPVITSNSIKSYNQMVTKVFKVYSANVDYIASKIRHLISQNAKLVTNKDSNTIALTDFIDNISTVKKVILEMTKDTNKTMELIKLKHLQAIDLKPNLDEIAVSKFNPQIETQKVVIIANKENNSIVLIGNRSNTAFFKKYILQMDMDDSLMKRVVEVYPLKNVEAKDVIKIIDGIIAKKPYSDPKDKPLSSLNEETNSIILMGALSEIKYIKMILAKLDKEKAQVYVKARIIELKDDLVDEIGIKYGIFGGKKNSSGIGTFASELNKGNTYAFTPANFGLGIPNITSGLALGASISLLNQDGALDVVSEPSILAINNKESLIYVGETISVKTSSTTTDGGNTNDNFQREDVGLTLKVKPRLSDSNKVTLEINTIIEDVKTTAGNGGNPDTLKREVKTTAVVNNGESVIIGGLIQDKEESTINKVPGFGDIPLVGRLFTHDTTDITKKSLVVIITPYIIPQSKDLTYVRNKLAELKILENKYLKDSLIRLKEKQIIQIEKEKEYKKRLEQLDKKLENLKNDSSSNKKLSEEELHQQRINKIFGI